jgi:rhodanese-related sulfurtransferase
MAMTFPLFPHGLFGSATGLLLGTLIGIGFGFVLERAGFGRARNLAAQFYLTDTRVLKVMFSAIVTALTGMAFLSGIRLLDLSQVTVPETFLWPQLVGGLLLGAGFIISGYCPGTSVVAAASGNLDGAVAILGMMAGSLAFGFGFGPLEKFYESGSMGIVRLTDLLGAPVAVIAAAVVAMAVGAFLAGEKVERILARRGGQPAPESPRAVKVRVFAGFAIAAVLSLAALALPVEKPAASKRLAQSIEPVELARGLIAAPEDFWLVDLRRPESVARGRIPGAMTLPPEDPGGFQVGRLPSTRRLVVYAQADVGTLPKGVERFVGKIVMLRGGYAAWHAAILAVPSPPESPTPAAVAEFRLRSALHSRYTGAAAVEAPRIDVKPAASSSAAPRKGGGC